jgi:SAM-dependent methyltransferase
LEIPVGDGTAGEPSPRVEPTPRTAHGATARYYDGLDRWTALAHAFRYGGGRNKLTVHRALIDPRADGRATVTRLHDLLLESLSLSDGARVLDAGCGYGGTMLAFARGAASSTFTGLTLSPRQAELGRRAIAAAGLANRIEILVRSYDDPPPGPFDAIVAVESLAHSRDPQHTIGCLCARLAPRGLIAIVDDMPDAAARGTQDLRAFQAGWHAPVLASAPELVARLDEEGLEIVVDRDLSAEQAPRTLARIATLERLNRLLRRVLPTETARALLDSYHGGLALERLYRRGLMTYRLLIARKL